MDMMVQMGHGELLTLLDSEPKLRAKVDEALIALRCHELLGSAPTARPRGIPSRDARGGKSRK
eukprot:15226144-Heterocapsa_arctica.AAC.1